MLKHSDLFLAFVRSARRSGQRLYDNDAASNRDIESANGEEAKAASEIMARHELNWDKNQAKNRAICDQCPEHDSSGFCRVMLKSRPESCSDPQGVARRMLPHYHRINTCPQGRFSQGALGGAKRRD